MRQTDAQPPNRQGTSTSPSRSSLRRPVPCLALRVPTVVAARLLVVPTAAGDAVVMREGTRQRLGEQTNAVVEEETLSVAPYF